MLPGFKESWQGLGTGQQAGLGGRKLLIAALLWKEWVWLRCDVKLVAGTASNAGSLVCYHLNELTMPCGEPWASWPQVSLLVLASESELCGWAAQLQVWGKEVVSSLSASESGGCFFCSSANLGPLKFPYAPVLSFKSQLFVSEAT